MPRGSGSGSAIEFEWVHDARRLEALAGPWRALDDDPFASPDWVLPWWASFGAGRELRTCLLWRDGQLAGVAPLARQGDHLAALANEHTPYYEICAVDDAARAALLEGVGAAPQRSLMIEALPADSPVLRILQEQRAGRRAVVRPSYLAPIVETQGSYAEYVAATRARWHTDLPARRRKMEREQSPAFRLIEQPQQFEPILRRGFAVEASGWKGQAGTAIVSDSRTQRFYEGVARRFAGQGKLALSWLCFGDEMVAFDMCLLARQRLYLIKIGFDERYKRYAPGLVLRLAVIRRCFEMGLVAHELLGIDMDWKLKFTDAGRRHVDVRLYPRTPLGTSEWVYRRYLRRSLGHLYRGALTVVRPAQNDQRSGG